MDACFTKLQCRTTCAVPCFDDARYHDYIPWNATVHQVSGEFTLNGAWDAALVHLFCADDLLKPGLRVYVYAHVCSPATKKVSMFGIGWVSTC